MEGMSNFTPQGEILHVPRHTLSDLIFVRIHMLTDIQRRAVLRLQEEGRMRSLVDFSHYKAPSLAQALSQCYKDTLDTSCAFTEFQPPAICSLPVEGHPE